MNILVTGGARYIGSHVIKQLGEQISYKITVLDNLSTGFRNSILYGDLIKGYSVNEVLQSMKKVSGVDFRIKIVEKRIGDIEAIVSENQKILTEMQWHPKYNNLDFICKSSLDWYVSNE